MNIGGLDKCSCIDWPGKLAAVVFTRGCNLDCFYCHNRSLLARDDDAARLSTAEVLAVLGSRRGFLDGVVLSGGEPTLQAGLADFIADVKALGYPVKLDTNGTRPHVLRALLDARLLDYVAMDVKAPREKYEAVCGVPVDTAALDQSIECLLHSGVDYEFRTTAAPPFSEEDVESVAHWIEGAGRFVLQQYRRPPGAEVEIDPRLAGQPKEAAWFHRALGRIERLVQHGETRGLGEVNRRTA